MKKQIKNRPLYRLQKFERAKLVFHIPRDVSEGFEESAYYRVIMSLREANKKGQVRFVAKGTLVATPEKYRKTVLSDRVSAYYDCLKIHPTGFVFTVAEFFTAFKHRPDVWCDPIDKMAMEIVDCLYESYVNPRIVKHEPIGIKANKEHKLTVTRHCGFCGTSFYGEITGIAPKCPNCGASLWSEPDKICS